MFGARLPARALCAALLMLTLPLAARADPVEGLWRTQPGDDGYSALVRVARCGAAICGTLEAGLDGAGQRVDTALAGRRMIWDMRAEGEGRYSGGKIWAPDRDKTYNARMDLGGDGLRVQGCVLGICRGQLWSRAE